MLQITNTFRQGTIGRFEISIHTTDDILVPQPVGLPTVEAVYIDPITRSMSTAVPQYSMYEIEPGRYYYEWYVPLDQPLLVHQVIYRGKIEEDDVIGEDIFTVLPLTPCCMFVPTVISTIKACRGCRS
jgi:hypothetical protein